jgi:hypothetical protein
MGYVKAQRWRGSGVSGGGDRVKKGKCKMLFRITI